MASLSLFEEKNKKNGASVGLPSGVVLFSSLTWWNNQNTTWILKISPRKMMKFMQQDVGFLLLYYCM